MELWFVIGIVTAVLAVGGGRLATQLRRRARLDAGSVSRDWLARHAIPRS
jgi:hypothetical protein